MNIQKFEDKGTLENILVTKIIRLLKKSIKEKGSAAILFSGGSTPKALMNQLAALEFDWSAVKVGLVDDRLVEESSEFSNLAMLKREFVNQIATDVQPTIYSLVFSPKDMDKNLELALEATQKLGKVDVALLGMGTDGHFASLFPNDSASTIGLSEACPTTLVYTKAPTHPVDRISFSWPSIKAVDHLFLHITGAEKLAILESVEKRSLLPIEALINNVDTDLEIYWAV